MKLIAAAVLWAVLTNGAPEPVASIDFSDGKGGNPDRIELFAERGECPEVGKRAVYYVGRLDNAEIPGCYLVREGMVYVLFADGDRGMIKADQFKWKPGKAPGKLI